mmetsp:Transcript_90808/g.257114  ORF Transcript_90808/g.257114 Transcript_90808/m.257114 type:complete len:224 (-) Transcript_90808:51-722(-)
MVAKQLLEGLVVLSKMDPPKLHRDLKMENVVVKNDVRGSWDVRIVDYGFMIDATPEVVQGKCEHKGTQGNRPPEVLEYTFDSYGTAWAWDVYGVGAIVLAMATGVDPHTFVVGTAQFVSQHMKCEKHDDFILRHVQTGVLFPWTTDMKGTCSITKVGTTEGAFSIMKWLKLIAEEHNRVLPRKEMFKDFLGKYGEILASMLHIDPRKRPHPQVLLAKFNAVDS